MDENLDKLADGAYKNKDYLVALDYYNLMREQDIVLFDTSHSFKFATCLYYKFIKGKTEITSQYCNAITYIVQRLPANSIYRTLAVLHYAELAKQKSDYNQVITALNVLDPQQISGDTSSFRSSNGSTITCASHRQKYYNLLSLAYEKNNQPELALNSSQEALGNIKTFTNNMDLWFQRRVAKAHIQQQEYSQAIEILDKIIIKKNEWFILHELAQCHLNIGDQELAKQQLLQMIDLAQEPKMLVTALLDFKIFSDEQPQLSKDAIILSLKIRQQEGWRISDERKDYLDEHNIKLESLPKYQKIFKNLKENCKNLQRASEIRHQGTISKILATGSGFIRCNNHKDYYFSRQQLLGKSTITVGSEITFALQNGFDHKKKETKQNAIHIELANNSRRDA